MAAPEYVPMAREHEGYAEREALKVLASSDIITALLKYATSILLHPSF
jgi:hypothetical protein